MKPNPDEPPEGIPNPSLERLSGELHHLMSHVDWHLTEHLSGLLQRHFDRLGTDLAAHFERHIADRVLHSSDRLSREVHGHFRHLEDTLSRQISHALAVEALRGPAAAGSAAALQSRILGLARPLRPMRAVEFPKTRIGNRNDGGYVMIDDFDDVGVAISLGVGAEVSWDLGVANRAIEVHQFDHTVERPPIEHERFRFHRKKIVPVEDPAGETIETILRTIGPDAEKLVLKIDIEGDEWPVLDAADSADLKRFSQIVCEFHNFQNVVDDAWHQRAERVIAKLATDFCAVHVHANNYGQLRVIGNVAFPEILEVTFANAARYKMTSTDEIFPSELDSPNRDDMPEIMLGAFRF